jgi:arsenite-transporting ATPase
MVIAEARRTYTYLSLFGYRVDAIVANRLLPDEITDPWFATWKELHAEHLATIEEGFAPLPVLRANLAADELVGPQQLRAFAGRLYGELDAAAVLHHEEPLRVIRRGATWELSLELPFTEHDDLELGRRTDELLIRVGPHRRALMLPDSLRRRPVSAASLKDGRLRVSFAADDHEAVGLRPAERSARTGR